MVLFFYIGLNIAQSKKRGNSKTLALIYTIYINIEAENPHLKKLFKISCPDDLKLFQACANSESVPLVDMSCYIKDLKSWLKVTTEEIYLQNFVINSKNLSDMIKSSAECKRVVIRA